LRDFVRVRPLLLPFCTENPFGLRPHDGFGHSRIASGCRHVPMPEQLFWDAGSWRAPRRRSRRKRRARARQAKPQRASRGRQLEARGATPLGHEGGRRMRWPGPSRASDCERESAHTPHPQK
jgi:hypothetical protein